MPIFAPPTSGSPVRALWGADRVARRPLPRMCRPADRLQHGPRRLRLRRPRTSPRPRVERARPPPARFPRRRARRRTRAGSGGRRHHLYRPRPGTPAGTEPPSCRVTRGRARPALGPPERAPARPDEEHRTAGVPASRTAPLQRKRVGRSLQRGSPAGRAGRRCLYDRGDDERRRRRAAKGRGAPCRRRHVRPSRAVTRSASNG